MIYVETGSTDVYFNFATEYYFASEKKLEDTVFLFWRTDPALMIGKYQNTFEEIDLEYAREKEIQVVRRLSGGGTIYTDLGGWQFSFIDYTQGSDIQFQDYIKPVIEALRELNVPCEFNGRNDLVIKGRKFSGNAQYKLNGSTVHHGSTLFSTNIEEMVRSTQVDPYKILSKSIKSVRDRVTNIQDHLDYAIEPEAFKQHMVKYMMNGSTSTYELSGEERRHIQQLADVKFRSDAIRFGANPKFTLTRTGRFAGGKITIQLEFEKSRIRHAKLCGDFFGNEQVERLEQVMTGMPLEREALLDVMRTNALEGSIYGITVEEIVETILS
ncbi:Lipoate-protein ligase LplJ [anaerobic digester metagenome]